jgi:hypothetical protein
MVDEDEPPAPPELKFKEEARMRRRARTIGFVVGGWGRLLFSPLRPAGRGLSTLCARATRLF